MHIAFTAHSIPAAMATELRATRRSSRETARLVAEAVGVADWAVVYQSRSGSPQVPWLEPTSATTSRALAARGVRTSSLAPIGFVSDHIEVLYDLDIEARAAADALGLASPAPGPRARTPRSSRGSPL